MDLPIVTIPEDVVVTDVLCGWCGEPIETTVFRWERIEAQVETLYDHVTGERLHPSQRTWRTVSLKIYHHVHCHNLVLWTRRNSNRGA